MKILGLFIIFLFIVTCTGREMHPEMKSSHDAKASNVRSVGELTLNPAVDSSKTYVPGQVLVKFKPNILQKEVNTIEKDLPLKIVRLVSHPYLYLMEILDDSSVESIIQQLTAYDIIEYAEPNYVRRIN